MMNVYYSNRIETAALSSPQSDPLMPLENSYHHYLGLLAGFTAPNATITGEWPFPESVFVSSLCIGLANAMNYTLTLFDVNGGEAYSSGEKSFGPNRIEILDFPGVMAGKFAIELSGNENITIGLLYLGDKLELPPFSPGPSYSNDFTSESERSMGGYSFGLRKVRLITFGANFPRVDNRDKKLIDGYMDETLDIQPHVIDPYPEAREEFAPFYGTLTSGLKSEKRDEGGFYWAFGLEWMEAK
jgi:hypothetical protein